MSHSWNSRIHYRIRSGRKRNETFSQVLPQVTFGKQTAPIVERASLSVNSEE